MKVAIMQPYFFPYIGYWQLIANSDEFVFFDVVQYNKKSWMNRNRILHSDKTKEFQYVSVSIEKHEKGTLINKVVINNNEKWKNKILGQLYVYKKLKAPFYNDTVDLINTIFNREYNTFLSLSIASTEIVCKHLGIDLNYKIASKIDFERNEIKAPGDWALTISKALDASVYINPHGGYEIFDEEKYNSNNIILQFLKPNLTPYEQSWRDEFMTGLSIIDVMMFCSKDDIKELLINDFEMVTKNSLKEKQ
ncbi:MAG: WbqC family protein [gamma proteobacterium symbiont of Lucinoma myriamae]|nr:WbqC family protein [gamma proteobacterium symbiont of Lucinoma myriamae]MCU7820025.1 WbqC family protein [gamma proteobacterium symbiont of Lucinoma myriamae]MCU7831390.1 WbqC family protein [gamma proteobacterium symbiont of Lucinoma myriamae]